MLKQLDMAVPSLGQLKSFVLPNFLSPERVLLVYSRHIKVTICLYLYSQHLTGSGVPFYVISIANVISQCMGNTTIAVQLARYPVFTDGPYM